jgi:hypothetical protein
LENSQMKKTLIAMAAVAVAGVASAQVAITGNVTYGYSVSDTASGFGTDGASLNFSASEDLGGGLTIAASMGIDGIVETADGTVYTKANGNNITLSGGFGSLSMTTGVGGDAVQLDQLMALGNGTVGSTVGYTAPAMGPVTLSVTRKSGDAAIGEGAGGSASPLNIYGVKFADGAIAAGYSLLSWIDTTNTNGYKKRSVVTASYDAGVAKVSVFAATQTYANGTGNLKNSSFQVTAPVGPLAVTFESGSSKAGTATALNGTSFIASYALSKRTAVTMKTEKWETSTTAKSKSSSLLLSHSF